MTNYKKNAAVVLLLSATLFGSGCSSRLYHNPASVNRLETKMDRKNVFLSTFIMKRKINWYGERDRNWVTFYKITPLYNYFTKTLLTRLAIKNHSNIDYSYSAKNAGITLAKNKRYLLQTKGVLLKKSYEFHRLGKELKIAPGAHFLIIELLLEMNKRNYDESFATLTALLKIRNRNGTTVYSKNFTQLKRLSKDDYKILFAFRDRTREKISKKTHHILTELFVSITEKMLPTIKKITR